MTPAQDRAPQKDTPQKRLPQDRSPRHSGFAALLPHGVEVSETGIDFPPARPSAEEEALVREAAGKRRREFTEGREHAHAALLRLGRPADAILRGEKGEPLWPEGVVGSITHCEGHRAAAVGLEGDVRSLGIDVEQNAPLPEGVLEIVLAADESREELAALGEAARRRTGHPVSAERLLFSAKESVYKAWFPLTGLWLDFHEVTIRFGEDGTFAARIRPDAGPAPEGVPEQMQGAWSAEAGLLRTAVAVRREAFRP